MINKVQISNEEELFAVLSNLDNYIQERASQTEKQPAEGKLDQFIEFVDFPHYKVTLRGDRFADGTPTRTLLAQLKIQEVLEDTYVDLIYEGSRKRAQQDLKNIDPVISFEQGSSIFLLDLTNFLNTIASKLTSDQAHTVTVVLILLILLSNPVIRLTELYYKDKRNKRIVELLKTMSPAEKKLHDIYKSICRQYPAKQKTIINRLRSAQNSLFISLSHDDKLVINKNYEIDVQTAQQLVPISSTRYCIEGEFDILTVENVYIQNPDLSVKNVYIQNPDLSVNHRNTYTSKLRVRNAHTQEELSVWVPKLSAAQEEIQQIIATDRLEQPVHMRIEIKEKNGRITRAKLISIKSLA